MVAVATSFLAGRSSMRALCQSMSSESSWRMPFTEPGRSSHEICSCQGHLRAQSSNGMSPSPPRKTESCLWLSIPIATVFTFQATPFFEYLDRALPQQIAIEHDRSVVANLAQSSLCIEVAVASPIDLSCQ